MRVLMISKALVVGSYQKKLEELARLPGMELALVVPPYWQEGKRRIYLERAYPAGYETIVENMALNGHFHLHFYPRLGRHIRGLRPAIVHIDEEPYNLATFQATWLAQRRGARVVFFAWQNIYRRLPFPFSWFEAYNFRHACHAIAGSPAAAAVLREKGYGGPIAVIPQFGVDPDLYAPAAQDPRGKPEGNDRPFVIGYLGRLVEEKGLGVLLRAVRGLPGRWQLVLIGAGPLEGELRRWAAEWGMGGQISFVPPLPSAEVPSRLRQMDALALPSLTRPNWKEQFGRALVEAMACGVPVVGSDAGEIPYVIGDAGLIFREGDAEELRARLKQLMDSPELRHQLRRRGRERVLARYTQAQVAQATYQVYQAMLGVGA